MHRAAFAFVTAAVVGCGPIVATQRVVLLPPKPDSCTAEQLQTSVSAGGVAGYNVVGSVSLVRRKYQSSVDLSDDNVRRVRAETCKLGGDAFAFALQSPNGIDFVVLQKQAAVSTQSADR